MNNLEKPDEKKYNILVTGSKGKGSVSRIVSSMLQSQGYKVGLFTGPHLKSFKERIRINGKAISDLDLIFYANRVKSEVHKITDRLEDGKYIGPVGISAAMAALYFLDNDTDFNIYECGKGAKYDDVSMIYSQSAIINTVFEEHIPQLGRNLKEIAYNKAGIIKPTQEFVVSAAQKDVVRDVIVNEAMENKVILYEYGNEFKCENINISTTGTTFDVITKKNEYRNINLKLLGRHQALNAALAFYVVEKLHKNIDINPLRKSMESLTWPGRLEIINMEPTIILDGCVNRECTKYIDEVLRELGTRNISFIIGVPDDKDYIGVIDGLKHFSNKFILTKTNTSHLKFSLDQYEETIKLLECDVKYTENIKEAIEYAKTITKSEDLICIVGTQSLIKDTKEYFNQDTLNL